MSDLISRQDAIDRINKQREHLQPDVYPQDEIGDAAYRICSEFIERLPSAQHWIPCSERLPEEEKKRYWVCTDTEYQCECRWTNNRFGLGEGEWGWSIFDTPQYSKPIAWMPLPEAWRGEEDEMQ